MARLAVICCVVVALLMCVAPAEAEENRPEKPRSEPLKGTLYGELGLVFNVVHVPEATADAGFGVRVAVGYHFTDKLRLHFAYRSLSNENKAQPTSQEDYSDVSIGVGLALDGKHFNMEGELTRASFSGPGFDEAGFGGGVYLTAGYPLAAQFKVIARVGAFIASVGVPSQGEDRTALWGLVGVALVYQGAPWGQ